MEEITNKTRNKRGYNPVCLKNLRPFQPGNHASPGRKPKADCLISCIKSELEKLSENKKSTNEELIAAALISMAKRGNLKAIEMCLDYISGRPTQQVNLAGKDGEQLFKSVHFHLPDGKEITKQT